MESDRDIVRRGLSLRGTVGSRALREESLLRQERWQAARAEAMDALDAGPPLWASALLTAVAWESTARLGETGAAPAPTERHVEMLRWHGRCAWVERMVAMGMEPRSHKLTRRQAALRRRQMGRPTRL